MVGARLLQLFNLVLHLRVQVSVFARRMAHRHTLLVPPWCGVGARPLRRESVHAVHMLVKMLPRGACWAGSGSGAVSGRWCIGNGRVRFAAAVDLVGDGGAGLEGGKEVGC